jgi:hypothetical protein
MSAVRWLVAIAVLLISACAASPPEARHRPPPDARHRPAPDPIGVRLPLADLGAPRTLTQRVVGSFGGQERTLRFELELTPDRLALVALTPLGVPVFALTYDGAASTVKTYAKDIPLPAADWILDDVLIANAPEAALRAALMDKNYLLRQRAGTREVVDADGRTVMRIRYAAPGAGPWGSDLVLDDDVLRYRLDITTLADTREEGAQ